jgi:uncharacterized protein YhaN
MIIAGIARVFGISTLLSTLITYGAIAALAFGLWTYQKHQWISEGEARCDARWRVAVEKEEDRRRQEQDELIRKYETEIAELRANEEKLNDELISLAVEAANDPNADSCGLGADSVQRVGKIR